MTAEQQPEERQTKPAKRHVFRKILKYFSLLLLVLILAVCGAAFWLTQTESGQAWAVKTVNSLLARPADGLGFKITSLSGSIPFDFEFGLESEDEAGIWLSAPKNRLVWNWHELPGSIHIREVRLADIDLSRLPRLPEAKEPPAPEKPLTLKDLQEFVRTGCAFLNTRHWWLPEVRLDSVEANVVLPEGLPLEKERLAADGLVTLAFVDNKLDAGAKLSARNQAGAKISLPDLAAESLGLSLNLKARPDAGGIAATCDVLTEIDGFALAQKDLPADFLGDEIRLGFNARADASPEALSINLAGPNLGAGHVNVSGEGSWQTDSGWQEGRLSGPLAYKLKLGVEPVPAEDKSMLRVMRAPAELAVTLAGNLPVLDLGLNLACAEITEAGHEIRNTVLNVSGEKIALPLDSSISALLEAENHLKLKFASVVDKQLVDLSTVLFFQAVPEKKDVWRIGLRDLALDALGLEGSGSLAMLLGDSKYPAADGSLAFRIRDWSAISGFVPDSRLSGDVSFKAALKSGLPEAIADQSRPLAGALPAYQDLRQYISVNLDIPRFTLHSGKKKAAVVDLAQVKAEASVEDIFANPDIKAQLTARDIAASGMHLSARASASGPLAGPLKAEVSSKGAVNADLAASWQPGRLDVSRLDAVADLSAFMGGKKLTAGVKSAGPAQFFYGTDGYRIQGLDVRLLPGGRLAANGGLSPEKLDLNLKLTDLDFKAFKNILPALPSGSVAATVNLRGSPQKPGGDFRIAVNNIAFPKSPLAPASATLAGDVISRPGGGALRAKLEINPATVKALGGTTSEIAASLPLLFGKDGIPALDMKGPLQAKIKWDGALGPIWNLLPIADQRLNGRIGIDAAASGTLVKPAVRGNVVLGKARYENLLLGVLLTDINLRLDLTDRGGPAKPGGLDSLPGQFKLDFSMSDGRGGTVTATGTGGIDGENLAVKTKITNLKPLRRRDIHVELSGDVTVAGTAKAPKINGEIVVDKGEVLLNNLAMTGSVTTLDITTPEELKKAAQAPAPVASGEGGQLNVRVRMLPRFSVEGRGLASIWQCNLLVSGPLTDPRVTGSINSVRGNFDFLGKVFALTKGRVFFGGGSIANPLVDIELTYDTPDLTAHIMVDGPVNKIRLTMTSDPTMPRDEIISRVLFGRSVNDLSRMEALQLAGAVAQLAGFGGGSGALGSVKKALGVDVLRIGTANTGSQNQSGDDTGGGTTLEMGKYINDYIYMGVQQGFKADSTAFIIEIELSPRSSLELRTEQNNTWGGIKWSKNY